MRDEIRQENEARIKMKVWIQQNNLGETYKKPPSISAGLQV